MLHIAKRATAAALLLAAALLTPSRAAHAQLTKYTFTGFGDLSFDGVAYAGKNYTVTLTADLANKVSGVVPCTTTAAPTFSYVNSSSATYDITGVSSGTLAPSFIYAATIGTNATILGVGQCAGGIPTLGLFGISTSATRPTSVAADIDETFTAAASLEEKPLFTSDAKGIILAPTPMMSLRSEPVSVPEPATAALLLPGLGLLVALRRRRLKA